MGRDNIFGDFDQPVLALFGHLRIWYVLCYVESRHGVTVRPETHWLHVWITLCG